MKSGWPGVSIRLTVTSPIGERHDGGLDRDPALALQRQRIGLRRAVVDAADLVDDAGGVEQPLGEGGLTGVDVRQDAKVERSSRQASYPRGHGNLRDGHERLAHLASLGCLRPSLGGTGRAAKRFSAATDNGRVDSFRARVGAAIFERVAGPQGPRPPAADQR